MAGFSCTKCPFLVGQVVLMCGVACSWCTLLFMAGTGRGSPERILQSPWLWGPSLFVLLVVVGIPEGTALGISEHPPALWVRVVWSTSIVIASFLGFLHPWLSGMAKNATCSYWYERDLGESALPWGRSHLHFNQWIFGIDSMQLAFLAFKSCSCVLQSHSPSRFTRCAVRYLNALWLGSLVWVVVWGHTLCGDPRSPEWKTMNIVGRNVAHFVNFATVIWVGVLAIRRLKALDATIRSASGNSEELSQSCSPWLQVVIWLFTFTWMVEGSALIFATVSMMHHSFRAYTLTIGVLRTLSAFCLAALVVVIFQAFRRLLSVLSSELNNPEASHIVVEEARWAVHKLRGARNMILASVVMSLLVATVVPVFGFKVAPGFIALVIIWDLRNCIDATTMAQLCSFRVLAPRQTVRYKKLQYSKSDLDISASPHPASGDPSWPAKVEELAGRGFYLHNLLDFLEALLRQQVMPFDPDRSTTNDVVRGAIIPLSRRAPPRVGGRALASVWSDDTVVCPEHMITHAWTNLFLHLVSAVVADALRVDVYYAAVSNRLRTVEGLDGIRQQLSTESALGSTYWVCAFSVNQHACICGGFGEPPESPYSRQEWDVKRKDSFGRLHEECGCGGPKSSDADPVACEINKFDDMMELLHRRVSGFKQVVAVDADFNLLQRCWCLAEIARAAGMGIPQNVLILSPEAMDRHYHLLSAIDVRACRASRPSDKVLILSKIPDCDAFNARLQWLMLGREGIFMRHLQCPYDSMVSASRVAARIASTHDGEAMLFGYSCSVSRSARAEQPV